MGSSDKIATCRLLTVRLSLVLFLQLFMMPLVRPFSASTLSKRSSLAFVPTRVPLPTLHKREKISTNNVIKRINAPLMAIDPTTSFDIESNFLLATSVAPQSLELQDNLQIEQLDPTTTVFVFIIGIIPFIWATYEFWRRIAVGASFGTGSDSVVIPSPFEDDENNDSDLIVIGEDGNPNSSRGRRTLDRGALTVAYILFAVAGGTVAIAVASVLMSPQAQPL